MYHVYQVVAEMPTSRQENQEFLRQKIVIYHQLVLTFILSDHIFPTCLHVPYHAG